MHQSPQRKLAKRRDKYTDFDLSEDTDADRRLYRTTQPKARRFAFRDESDGQARQDKSGGER
jgi:hypothetical protein